MDEQLLKEIITEVKKLNQRFDSLEESQAKTASKVDRLETRIESEVIEKICILHDAHSLHMDYFASIKDSQARIEDGIDSLFRRSIETITRLREHDREIRLLRAEKRS